jgi:hypothetical protein
LTTTYTSMNLIVNGAPYIFSVDATDGTEANMVNLVSGLGIGDTFSAGGVISYAGPVMLNSSDGTGSSSSILGAVLLDAQNNVVAQFNWVDPETQAPNTGYQCKHAVGLNYALKILTAN